MYKSSFTWHHWECSCAKQDCYNNCQTGKRVHFVSEKYQPGPELDLPFVQTGLLAFIYCLLLRFKVKHSIHVHSAKHHLKCYMQRLEWDPEKELEWKNKTVKSSKRMHLSNSLFKQSHQMWYLYDHRFIVTVRASWYWAYSPVFSSCFVFCRIVFNSFHSLDCNQVWLTAQTAKRRIKQNKSSRHKPQRYFMPSLSFFVEKNVKIWRHLLLPISPDPGTLIAETPSLVVLFLVTWFHSAALQFTKIIISTFKTINVALISGARAGAP